MHLPSSFGHTVIWVVYNRLSKSAHFIAHPMSFTVTHLANRFSDEICRLHGVPKSILLDCDPVFQSRFWKELFHLQGTKLKFSMAYHPQTDGQNRSYKLLFRSLRQMLYQRKSSNMVSLSPPCRVLVQLLIPLGHQNYALLGSVWTIASLHSKPQNPLWISHYRTARECSTN